MSSYFFDNVDYYSDVLSDPIGEFNAIVPKIRDDFVSYKKGLFLSDRSHDVRFKDKMHGHTAYSWKAFCLKPRDSKIERFAGSFFLALLPIANVTDIVINIGILGKETLKSLDNLIMKTTSVVLRLFPVLKDKASFNAHKTHALNSFFYTMLSTGLLFMEIPLVPLYWIGLCPIRLNHSYYLFDKEKNIELVNDGGWHFNNLMNPKKISLKLKTFAHTEYESNQFSHLSIVKEKILNREDLFNRNFVYDKIYLDKSFPEYIIKNQKKYKEWII